MLLLLSGAPSWRKARRGLVLVQHPPANRIFRGSEAWTALGNISFSPAHFPAVERTDRA